MQFSTDEYSEEQIFYAHLFKVKGGYHLYYTETPELTDTVRIEYHTNKRSAKKYAEANRAILWNF